MNKKIAVIFYGLPRLFDISTRSLCNMVQKYNADVFVHTWHTENYQNDIDKINKLFNPILIQSDDYLCLDTSIYNDRAGLYTNIYNTLSMWVSTQRAYKLMEQYYTETNTPFPDIVVKARFDLYIDDFDLLDTGTLVMPIVPRKTTEIFYYKDHMMIPNQDVICYGPVNPVKIYCNLIDNIPNLMQQCNEIPFISESMLVSHLWENQIPYYSQLVFYNLIRS